MLPSAREVWRNGIAPCLTTPQLVALRDALELDDPRLIQGATCSPPPLACVQDWPVEAACGIGYGCVPELGGFADNSLDRHAATVAQVEEFFAKLCFECDGRLGKPAACGLFINWFDDTPRDEMRRELLVEVNLALFHRPHEGEILCLPA